MIRISRVWFLALAAIFLALIIFGVLRYKPYIFERKNYVTVKNKYQFDLDRLNKISNIVPVAVLGSGPAGLSAALYTARAKVYTVVFAGSKPGGQLMGTTDVENWPGIPKNLGPNIMDQLKKQAQDFGVVYVHDTVVKADLSKWPFVLTTEDGRTINVLSLVIATGATPRTLGVKGEQEYWGKGVTTCAICDAPRYQDGKVVVVGGGDSAVEEAIQLAAYANDITILVRGDAMRAARLMQERLGTYNYIKIAYNTEITAILGDGEHVQKVELINNRTKEKKTMATQAVFLAIGHEPNTTLFKDYLSHNERGYLNLEHPTQKTSAPGVFAAGDVADERYRQAGVAAGDGIKAGLDAISFLKDIGFNDVVARSLESNYFEIFEANEHLEVPHIETQEQFDQQVSQSPVPVVVDFYATYCPSCIQMMPAISLVASKLQDTVKFFKVDIDKAPAIATKNAVSTLPAILVFNEGHIIARSHQAMTNKQLYDFVVKALKVHDKL